MVEKVEKLKNHIHKHPYSSQVILDHKKCVSLTEIEISMNPSSHEHSLETVPFQVHYMHDIQIAQYRQYPF